MMNGIALRDERDNTSFVGLNLTTIEEVQVQTGGFNAEYGNIRSGLVNIITKEGDKEHYNVSFEGRYHPSTAKNFGQSFNDPNSFWMRPYVDPAVCWTGTSNWDSLTQTRYNPFDGWYAEAYNKYGDSSRSADMQKQFLFEHRKTQQISKPDYDYDMTAAGPIPLIGKSLGNLRFLLSYRGLKEMYLVPLATDGYSESNTQFKLTSDISPKMKVTVDGLFSQVEGTAATDNGATTTSTGQPGIFRTPESIAYRLGYNDPYYIDSKIFSTDYFSISSVKRNLISAKFSNFLSSQTFYEISLSRFASSYFTRPGAPRDTSKIYYVGGEYLDEGPFGYQPEPSFSVDGMRMGSQMALARDSSAVAVYTLKADFASQIDHVNNLQLGLEFVYTDNDINYGWNDPFLQSYNTHFQWHTYPLRGALYVQDKLEFEGMIANVGFRLDYSNPNEQWYNYALYDTVFTNAYSDQINSLLQKTNVSPLVTLSPRLGIAFPVTENSKLYFNYGIFRSIPQPENFFLVGKNYVGNVTQIANPQNPFPKTIAYELGYEHSLFDQFLLRLAGYYKSVFYEPVNVNYIGLNNNINYNKSEPNGYADIRGFEATISKNTGDWVHGFINYTYMVTTKGWFDYQQYNENTTTQANYVSNIQNIYQEKPMPMPYARANIDFFTPEKIGSAGLGQLLISDWHVNFLASWQSGSFETWAGGSVAASSSLANNLQWLDYYNVDLRVSKSLRLDFGKMEIFADVMNLFNIKHLNQDAFLTVNERTAYIQSLHMPEELGGNRFGYSNSTDLVTGEQFYVAGNDKPGDYSTVPYTPYNPNDPNPVHKQWVLNNKAYIKMPSQEFLWFLNPRMIYIGLRFSVNI
jgi:hypothetical protein